MKTMKAILFDLDGVLIDSLNSWLHAFNETMKKFGYREFGEKEFKEKFWGPELKENLREMRINNGVEIEKYCISKQMEFLSDIKLFPETEQVLDHLYKKFKIGLITNTPRENVKKVLNKFDLEKYFDVIVTGDDVINGKPDPEMVSKACELLAVEPKDAILVGDTESDVIAGQSAGCAVVGIKVHGDYEIEKLSNIENLPFE
jgi:phosphoglycolate phosphatase/pyrophosphatase PpaX